jgi:hypothetical protein
MKTLSEVRDMIATTQAGDTDRILDICNEIVMNLQRIETKLNSTRRVADNAAFGPARIGSNHE